MKIIIDTNVLVSAAFRDRLPESVILWILAHPEWARIASEEIIREYKEVLRRPKFKLTDAQIQYWRDLIDEAVEIVPVSATVDFPRDRKDAKFLACALAHRVDVLLTGDRDFEDADREINKMKISQFSRFTLDLPENE
uniref:Putative toxin-antitoxin system toxin component, PIN family n=1 Tax=Candidatus Kentrum sp. DK TaxID=2126562 RepID=A0A450TF17_9GAMM|nr:MAG: putative toxin-antitoxin system toxin component, PIN family [Candidatus Kentron sp. DK]